MDARVSTVEYSTVLAWQDQGEVLVVQVKLVFFQTRDNSSYFYTVPPSEALRSC